MFNTTTGLLIKSVDPNEWQAGNPADEIVPPANVAAAEAITQRHRKWTGTQVARMNAGERAAVEAAGLPGIRAAKIANMTDRAHAKLDDAGYDTRALHVVSRLMREGRRLGFTNRVAALAPIDAAQDAVMDKLDDATILVNAAADAAAVRAVSLDIAGIAVPVVDVPAMTKVRD
tara:strand:- start:14015 stop:14536 length:522 start_codon:yes stop_codon:yes gene_type:complete